MPSTHAIKLQREESEAKQPMQQAWPIDAMDAGLMQVKAVSMDALADSLSRASDKNHNPELGHVFTCSDPHGSHVYGLPGGTTKSYSYGGDVTVSGATGGYARYDGVTGKAVCCANHDGDDQDEAIVICVDGVQGHDQYHMCTSKSGGVTSRPDFCPVGTLHSLYVDWVTGATPVPTPAPASATGDPHMQNIHGERFDLMKEGNVVLINIPRGLPVKDSLLTVEAKAGRLGISCDALYFQTINITGKWASSDIHFKAGDSPDKQPTWLQFGPVEMKVAHGRTEKGLKYLNFFVKHLGRAGAAVGGLLGEDDHTEAATPSATCRKTVSLVKPATHSTSDPQYGSVAVAAL